MMTALQTLIDNGCSDTTIEAILNEVLGSDIVDGDDKLCCIAKLFDVENGDHDDADGYTVAYGNTVDGPRGEYLVLDDDEADAACKEYIEQSLLAFCPSFLGSETGIDQIVFEALNDKCAGANDAVRSIINGSCGIDSFVESAISADGRGHFLSGYDSAENEVAGYYIYRQN